MSYKGWKNRETWALHAFLSNDEGAYLSSKSISDGYNSIESMATAFRDYTASLQASVNHDDFLYMVFKDIGDIDQVDFLEIAEFWSKPS